MDNSVDQVWFSFDQNFYLLPNTENPENYLYIRLSNWTNKVVFFFFLRTLSHGKINKEGWEICNTPTLYNQKKEGLDFIESHVPHLRICSPPHILTKYLPHTLWLAISLPLTLLSFIFFSYNTPLSHSLTLPLVHTLHHHLHRHFSNKVYWKTP